MANYEKSRDFQVTINGQVQTVKITYESSYESGPFEENIKVKVDPCRVLQEPEFLAQTGNDSSEIRKWLADQVLDSRKQYESLGLGLHVNDDPDIARNLADTQGLLSLRLAEKCRDVDLGGNSTSVTAIIDKFGQESGILEREDGSELAVVFDNNNTLPWSTHITEYAADGHIIGNVFDYETADLWSGSHSLAGAHLSGLNEGAVNVLQAEIERFAFHGTAVDEAAPGLFSYESFFNNQPFYDFSAGNFNIDDGASAASVELTGGSVSYDLSGLDYWNNVGFGYDTYVYDGWSYGDWIEPVVLDLNGDGVDITGRVDSTVYFDVDADGFKEQTAWAGPADGLLVIDLAANGAPGPDGKIDQAMEIAFARWTSAADTDLAALAAVFETNHNNAFDGSDARWGRVPHLEGRQPGRRHRRRRAVHAHRARHRVYLAFERPPCADAVRRQPPAGGVQSRAETKPEHRVW